MSASTLGSLLQHLANHHGDSVALSFEGRQTTFRDMHVHANQVANGLAKLGLEVGSRVAFLSKNSDALIETAFACGRGGFIIAGINWRLLATEVAFILRDCAPDVLFITAEFRQLAEEAIQLSEADMKLMAFDDGNRDLPAFRFWRDQQSTASPTVSVRASDPVVLMYTSGTTGQPKGVVLPHRSFFLLDSIKNGGELAWTHWSKSDRNLVAMPCFHVGGLAYAIWGLCGGAMQVILKEFDAAEVLSVIETQRVTRACIVSPALKLCLQHPACQTADLSSLEVIQYGAAPLDEQTLVAVLDAFRCELVQNYGMTETTGAATYLPAADHQPDNLKRLASLGKPLPGVEMKIADTELQELPTNRVGEILIRSPANMICYWNKPEETQSTVVDGFIRTGDVGYFDDEGYLFLVDRLKDIIISGGENVSSKEVEAILVRHPGVADVAVVGLPDERWGEAVTAFVVRSAGVDAGGDEIIAFARTQLAPFKAPKTVRFVSQLPRNSLGKVLKHDLRRTKPDAAHDPQNSQVSANG